MKQNYVTMTKTIGDTKVKHMSLLILKISFLTLFGCGVNPYCNIFWFGDFIYEANQFLVIHPYVIWTLLIVYFFILHSWYQ